MGDTCGGGSCQPGGGALDCDDGNGCTDDSCDPATGCVNANNTAPCDDGNPCTVDDTCGGGACISGLGPDCDDGDECTFDDCDPAEPDGCTHTITPGAACTSGNGESECSGPDTCQADGSCGNNDFTDGTPCNDGLDCNVGESCTGGACGGGGLPDCNDGNPCTTDTCIEPGGCDNAIIEECDVPLDIVPDSSCVDAPGSCCVDEGTTLCVDITAANGGTGVCGAQIFLEFDTCSLQAISITAGDYPNVLVPEWDNEAGTVTIAVGVANNAPCLFGNTVIATVCFDTTICTDCCPAVLIEWSEFNPQIPIKLTNAAGEVLPHQLLAEPDIGINDGPPVLNLPEGISVPSDVGKCVAVVDFETSATDCGEDLGLTCTQVFTAPGSCNTTADCTPGLTCTEGACSADLGLASGDQFPVGCTTFTCTTDADCCGNTTMDSFDVCVTGTTQGIFDVQLSPTIAGALLTRCIEFCFFNCDNDFGGVEVACVEQEVTFGGIFSPPGVAQQVTVDIPCTFGQYDCASARDPLHTLRSFATDFGFDFDSGTYTGTWAGNLSWLIGGNLNGDTVIDIVDFGAWLGQLGFQFDPPDTTCADSPVHADINGDGIVDSSDFTFILVNFFAKEDDCCDIGGIEEEPRSSVRVRDLQREGLGHLRIADLNNDGWIDIDDMLLYAEGNGIDVPQQMGGGFTPQN
ncbi:MAG: hypothetical protein IID36_07175 [Planctomycetes bacterium]|nr:hypothetical protein [Planctomycetota bacterium]